MLLLIFIAFFTTTILAEEDAMELIVGRKFHIKVSENIESADHDTNCWTEVKNTAAKCKKASNDSATINVTLTFPVFKFTYFFQAITFKVFSCFMKDKGLPETNCTSSMSLRECAENLNDDVHFKIYMLAYERALPYCKYLKFAEKGYFEKLQEELGGWYTELSDGLKQGIESVNEETRSLFENYPRLRGIVGQFVYIPGGYDDFKKFQFAMPIIFLFLSYLTNRLDLLSEFLKLGFLEVSILKLYQSPIGYILVKPYSIQTNIFNQFISILVGSVFG